MVLQESRRAARTSARGELILLQNQDRSLWKPEQIKEGICLVETALQSRRFGPYTLQASIAAVHAENAGFDLVGLQREDAAHVWAASLHGRSFHIHNPAVLCPTAAGWTTFFRHCHHQRPDHRRHRFALYRRTSAFSRARSLRSVI